MVIKKPYLLIFWFLPIFVAMLTFRLKEFGLADYISYVQLLLVLSGLFYLLMQSKIVHFSLRVLFILLSLAFNMLYSDIGEYQLVVFSSGLCINDAYDSEKKSP